MSDGTFWIGAPATQPQGSPKSMRLERIKQAAREAQAQERLLDEKREQLYALIREAYPAVPQTEIAEAAQISRQRVSQIVS